MSTALGFGIGIEEVSEKIHFDKISSTLLALRQGPSWRKVGVMDISLPLSMSLTILGNGLSLDPLVTITDDNLFDTNAPDISLDLNLE